MNNNIELKETITLDEYKAWLTGLLRGKGNQLPDLHDWKAIKKMTEKIVPDMVEVQNPSVPNVPSFPSIPYTPVTDKWAPWHQNEPTSTNDIEYLNGIEIKCATSDTSIVFADSGSISINGHGLTTITSTGGDDGIELAPIADYGCYGGSHANSYAPPAPKESTYGNAVGFCSPHMAEDNEVTARSILDEIRRRSNEAKQASVVTDSTSPSALERLAVIKKRLQE